MRKSQRKIQMSQNPQRKKKKKKRRRNKKKVKE